MNLISYAAIGLTGEWQQLTGLDKVTQAREQALQRSVHRGPLGKNFELHPALECFTLFRMRTVAALNEEHRWPHRVARNPVALTCHLLQLLADLPFESGEAHEEHGRGDPLGGDSCSQSVSSLDAEGDAADTCSLRDERGSSVHGNTRGAGARGGVRRAGAMYDRVLESKAFRRVQEATAELQAVDLSTLNQRGLLCFWINIHNALAVSLASLFHFCCPAAPAQTSLGWTRLRQIASLPRSAPLHYVVLPMPQKSAAFMCSRVERVHPPRREAYSPLAFAVGMHLSRAAAWRRLIRPCP